MKLISLNCNHCGAPIEVPKPAKFVTCRYCNARLAIHHTGNSYSTELLDQIKSTTDSLVREVEILKGNSELERLDREWERTRCELLKSDEDGSIRRVPTKREAKWGSILYFGLGMVFITAGLVVPPVAIIGIISILVGIPATKKLRDLANDYDSAKQLYSERRYRLIKRINRQREESSYDDRLIF